MSRANRKGRTSSGPGFIQLYRYITETPAWKSLKPSDRAVYWEVLALYRGQGSNNGSIALGVRDAAERANINKDTAGECFRRLIDRGLLECASPGGFSRKVPHAAEWRLTQYPCDRTHRLPSKAFLKWRPENAERGPSVPDSLTPGFGQSSSKKAPTVPSFRTVGAA